MPETSPHDPLKPLSDNPIGLSGSAFGQFQSQATTHDVTIPPEVIAAAENPNSLGQYTFTPTDMLAAIAAAGHMRRRKPKEPLIEHPLPETEEDTFLDKTLKTMLAAGHEFPGIADLPSFSYDQKIDTVSACDWADQRLGSVLHFLKSEKTVAHAQIITSQGVPLFVRKGSPGHASAMNIRPFMLNGGLILPGTILRVDTTYDIPQTPVSTADRRIYDRLPPDNIRGNEVPWGLSTLDINDVTQIGYGRLSTFALPPEERTGDMLPRLEGLARLDPAAADFVRTTTMEDITTIVDRALPHAKQAYHVS